MENSPLDLQVARILLPYVSEGVVLCRSYIAKNTNGLSLKCKMQPIALCYMHLLNETTFMRLLKDENPEKHDGHKFLYQYLLSCPCGVEFWNIIKKVTNGSSIYCSAESHVPGIVVSLGSIKMCHATICHSLDR
jgi:hypothetical protein